ncbi:MAG: transposase [Candidatus Omnitrophica bacterium]|nr:transposase [Candidatus Omnitrophota bacterium]
MKLTGLLGSQGDPCINVELNINAAIPHLPLMGLVTDFWIRMAKLYSSIEQGQATASVVLRRLLSRDESNDFYKANLHLGRIFKTEHILQHMTDPQARLRKRRGLLKGEQIHQLARDVNYANRGKITARDDKSQNLVCSCLTLIMACIVWGSRHRTPCY